MERAKIDFFLAGIIQGSRREATVHDQSYRGRIRRAVEDNVPGARVFCPIEHHPNSLRYDDDEAQSVFMDLLDRAERADVLLAYLPEASMGTAIEIWRAWRAGRLVLAITPLKVNWVIRFLTRRAFETIDEFEDFAASGALRGLVDSWPDKG